MKHWFKGLLTNSIAAIKFFPFLAIPFIIFMLLPLWLFTAVAYSYHPLAVPFMIAIYILFLRAVFP
jgi:hypothetical protein